MIDADTGSDGSQGGSDGATVEVVEWMGTPGEDARRDLLEMRLRQSRIPRKYLSKTFGSFIATDKKRKRVKEVAMGYIDSFCSRKGDVSGLMIEGRVGCGKTHVAVAILREIILQGYTGLYCNVPEFLKEMRGTYSATIGPDESELIDETREIDLLVLDDLGVEGRVLDPIRDRSKWLCERLYLIVNGRYEIDKPIVVTTNCDLDSLVQQLDERIVSRLVEMTSQGFPPFPDEDYRRKHLR